MKTSSLPIDRESTNITMGWTLDNKKIYVTSNANDQGTDAVALLGFERERIRMVDPRNLGDLPLRFLLEQQIVTSMFAMKRAITESFSAL